MRQLACQISQVDGSEDARLRANHDVRIHCCMIAVRRRTLQRALLAGVSERDIVFRHLIASFHSQHVVGHQSSTENLRRPVGSVVKQIRVLVHFPLKEGVVALKGKERGISCLPNAHNVVLIIAYAHHGQLPLRSR